MLTTRHPMKMHLRQTIFSGDFEGVDLAVPSKFSQQPGSPKPGHSLYPKVGGADVWQILHGEPPLPPQLGIQHDDLRAQIRPDTARPWHGRHTLRLMIPAANSYTILPIPLLAESYGTEGAELNEWTLRLRLRASPAIANLSIVSGGCYIGGGVKNASGWFGAYYVPCPDSPKTAKVRAQQTGCEALVAHRKVFMVPVPMLPFTLILEE